MAARRGAFSFSRSARSAFNSFRNNSSGASQTNRARRTKSPFENVLARAVAVPSLQVFRVIFMLLFSYPRFIGVDIMRGTLGVQVKVDKVT
ncbi:hypothetical protein SUGI_0445050 [Cryptomeria japonica]|nr:hypothetical protein SUGI_0445050 [Cryptomeria japonica]